MSADHHNHDQHQGQGQRERAGGVWSLLTGGPHRPPSRRTVVAALHELDQAHATPTRTPDRDRDGEWERLLDDLAALDPAGQVAASRSARHVSDQALHHWHARALDVLDDPARPRSLAHLRPGLLADRDQARAQLTGARLDALLGHWHAREHARGLGRVVNRQDIRAAQRERDRSALQAITAGGQLRASAAGLAAVDIRQEQVHAWARPRLAVLTAGAAGRDELRDRERERAQDRAREREQEHARQGQAHPDRTRTRGRDQTRDVDQDRARDRARQDQSEPARTTVRVPAGRRQERGDRDER